MGEETTLTAVLITFYSLICLIAFIQLLRIFYYKHRILSFHFGFLLCVFTWNILRILFFIRSWSTLATYIFYWYPIDIQFATFSLLVVYYAYLTYVPLRLWSRKRSLVITVYTLVNLSVFFLTSCYIVIGCSTATHKCHISPALDNAHHIYLALQFSVLVIVFALYSCKLSPYRINFTNFSIYSISNENKNMFVPSLLNNDTTNNAISTTDNVYKHRHIHIFATIMAFLIFTSRAIYNILVVFGYGEFTLDESSTGGLKLMQIPVFLLYFFWEIIPTVALLMYFRVPSTNMKRILCCWQTSNILQPNIGSANIVPYSPYGKPTFFNANNVNSTIDSNDPYHHLNNENDMPIAPPSNEFRDGPSSYLSDNFANSFYQDPHPKVANKKEDLFQDTTRYDTDEEN